MESQEGCWRYGTGRGEGNKSVRVRKGKKRRGKEDTEGARHTEGKELSVYVSNGRKWRVREVVCRSSRTEYKKGIISLGVRKGSIWRVREGVDGTEQSIALASHQLNVLFWYSTMHAGFRSESNCTSRDQKEKRRGLRTCMLCRPPSLTNIKSIGESST